MTAPLENSNISSDSTPLFSDIPNSITHLTFDFSRVSTSTIFPIIGPSHRVRYENLMILRNLTPYSNIFREGFINFNIYMNHLIETNQNIDDIFD